MRFLAGTTSKVHGISSFLKTIICFCQEGNFPCIHRTWAKYLAAIWCYWQRVESLAVILFIPHRSKEKVVQGSTA
jgi:hypothetical protein